MIKKYNGALFKIISIKIAFSICNLFAYNQPNELILPQEQPDVIQPIRFGIGSYFKDVTWLHSIISFSVLPNMSNLIPVLQGMIDESPLHMNTWRSITDSKNIQMLPTVHCANTSIWRKKIIQAAEHNIVISGNYCGQHAFDEILEIIKAKLESNRTLKVVIISSPDFIKDQPNKNIKNKTLINELLYNYPLQFSIVYSPSVWFLWTENGYKKSTNHIKYVGIDWGRYYIMGGSSIKDNFSMSGVDNIFEILPEKDKRLLIQFQSDLFDLKEAWREPNLNLRLLKIKNQECIELAKTCTNALLHSSHFSQEELFSLLDQISSVLQLLNRALLIQKDDIRFYAQNADQLYVSTHNDHWHGSSDDGFMGMLVPGNFRDMDFVFSDANDSFSSGRQLFLEIIRMAYRWETLNAAYENKTDISSFTPYQVANLPIFTGDSIQDVYETDSITHRIMKEPMPNHSQLYTQKIVGFEDSAIGSLQMMYQGPEQLSGTSEFASKTLELIRNAQKRIVFNHMYFCPTDEIIEALKEAVEQRGVQIEIITCANTLNCPNGQKTFGPYNKWNWVKLANQIAPEHRNNLRVFLFTQIKKGLHKKVIVVDDKVVLAGSSNFGYKSLVTSSDYEINFIAKSEDFAQKTLAVFEEDKQLSEEVLDTTQISKVESFQALFYHESRSLVN